MEMFTIGKLAKETGFSARAIRFYEKIGLLPKAERSFSSGYRLYTKADIKRLRLVRRFKLLGFRLSQIRNIVASLKGKDCECRRLRPQLRRLVAQELQEIERKIIALTRLRAELEEVQKTSTKVPLPQGFCLCSETPLMQLRSKARVEMHVP